MFKKLKKKIEKNRQMNQEIRELTFLLGGLDWIECRDAVIRINNNAVSVEIFEEIDGQRVRRAEGKSDNLADAIKDVADIIDAQDGKESH